MQIYLVKYGVRQIALYIINHRTNLSSLAVPDVVILTTSGLASDDNIDDIPQWLVSLPGYAIGEGWLTYQGRDKVSAPYLQRTFLNSFSLMKIVFRFKFHWNRFSKVHLTISQHWFRKWLGAEQVTSHYLNKWWSSLVTYICATRPQGVDSWRECVEPN